MRSIPLNHFCPSRTAVGDTVDFKLLRSTRRHGVLRAGKPIFLHVVANQFPFSDANMVRYVVQGQDDVATCFVGYHHMDYSNINDGVNLNQLLSDYRI